MSSAPTADGPLTSASGTNGARAKNAMRQDCFLGFCRTVNVVTGLSALLCLVAHSMALAQGPPLFNHEGSRLQVLRAYSIGIALLLMLVETEWPWVLDGVRLLDNWVGRATVQGLLAVMTLELATSAGTSDFDLSLRLYRQIAGLCMLGCASFYCVGGILCFAALRRARHRRESERLRAEADLADLERQREELQSLLAVYTRE